MFCLNIKRSLGYLLLFLFKVKKNKIIVRYFVICMVYLGIIMDVHTFCRTSKTIRQRIAQVQLNCR